MTVLENLLVARHARVATSVLGEGLWSRRTRRAEVEHRRVVEEILAFVELTRYRHQPVSALPFGIQKVIGFARALALEPRVLLLDEPSAGLNREEREDLARHILRIKHERGLAMIWVEHDMQMVADLADRLYVLELRRAPGRRPARRRAQRSPRRRGLPGATGRRRCARRIIRALRRTSHDAADRDERRTPGRRPRPARPTPAAELSGRTIRALLARQRHPVRRGRRRRLPLDRRRPLLAAQRRRRARSSGSSPRIRDDAHTIHAGTQPAALYRSRDGGDSWVEDRVAVAHVPGAERWCLPNSPAGARARALAIDPVDPNRWWVGIEVGGVATSTDAGASWTCVAPGNDPDVHVLVGHPGRPGVLYATTGLGRFQDDPEPMGQRIAGLFGSEDGGDTWRYLWTGLEPRYTRPMCIDPRAPHA